ncbi:hypothetical protein MOQ33_00440 [Escherichia coli]|uniref:hypothetical protein n=1 Tax=Escherichia coli TaxID=562 RepID=UPI00214990C2|nr:hypothetical protein [Escherichia coli]MCR1105753.1 hypothetical protein [Escherichia coli]MDT9424324.1 hypothetical protein [Escherichia coli]
MNTVEWGLVDYCPQVPVICGAEKYSEDRFIVPLVSTTTKRPVSEGAITGLLAHLNDGKVPVISSKIEAVLDGAEVLFPIRDVNDIVGRVLTGWLEDDGVVKALIHIDRDTPNAERVKQALNSDATRLQITVMDVGAENKYLVEYFVPMVSIEPFDRIVEQPEPTADKIVTPAVMRSITADNSVLNNESIILRGIVPTGYNGEALLVRIPELNNRRVFIGCVGYEVLYFDAEGRAVIATKSKLFNQHKAQASATQPYRLVYSEDKVTIWFVNGNDTLNSAFPEKTFKPVTLIEMFGGEAYVANCVNGQFRLPSCCEFKTDDTITVNNVRVSLIRIDASSGFAVFEPHGMILENLKEACKVSEPFGDERSLIIVKRTDVDRVEITVSQPMSAKTK